MDGLINIIQSHLRGAQHTGCFHVGLTFLQLFSRPSTDAMGKGHAASTRATREQLKSGRNVLDPTMWEVGFRNNLQSRGAFSKCRLFFVSGLWTLGPSFLSLRWLHAQCGSDRFANATAVHHLRALRPRPCRFCACTHSRTGFP